MNRFWSKVDQSGGPDACWPWMAYRNADGYGTFSFERRIYKAHRFVIELTRGAIPAGLEVRHRCDNPPCCNPAHLELGTHRDNLDDMIRRGRSLAGERGNKAKLTETAVREIRAAWAVGQQTQTALARQYGVHPSVVSLLVRNKIWRHV